MHSVYLYRFWLCLSQQAHQDVSQGWGEQGRNLGILCSLAQGPGRTSILPDACFGLVGWNSIGWCLVTRPLALPRLGGSSASLQRHTQRAFPPNLHFWPVFTDQTKSSLLINCIQVMVRSRASLASNHAVAGIFLASPRLSLSRSRFHCSSRSSRARSRARARSPWRFHRASSS